MPSTTISTPWSRGCLIHEAQEESFPGVNTVEDRHGSPSSSRSDCNGHVRPAACASSGTFDTVPALTLLATANSALGKHRS